MVFDLTTGSGSFAKLCLEQKIPYAGFVFTEPHSVFLRSHLTEYFLKKFGEEGSPNYKPSFAALIEQLQQGGEDAGKDDKGKNKAPPKKKRLSGESGASKKSRKGTPKGKAKAKGKKAEGKAKAGGKKKAGKKRGAIAAALDDEGEESESADSGSESLEADEHDEE